MSIIKGSVEQRPDLQTGPKQTGDVAQGALNECSLSPEGSKHLRLAYSAGEAESVAMIVQMRSGNGTGWGPSNGQRGLLDRTIQAQIGRMLRDLFSDAADEPVPERFTRLLEALEAEEKRR
jgi:hypothetical protein